MMIDITINIDQAIDKYQSKVFNFGVASILIQY